MIYGANLDVLAKPSESGGSDTTGYCDGQYISTATARVVRRSSWYADPVGGVAYVVADCDASDSGSSIGSRVAFSGTLVEVDDVNAFGSLPVR